ncbi:ImmA/IrrE family metallo-endopeptidase [Pseudomonas gingeri]
MTSTYKVDDFTLNFLFGAETKGAEIIERARHSSTTFVRSQDHLALFKEGATGRKLSAYEALEYFGIEKLAELADYSTAILPVDKCEPSRSFKNQISALGLKHDTVAKRAKVSKSDVLNSEKPSSILPIQTLEKLAIALGLDERFISTRYATGVADNIAARLKSLKNNTKLGAETVQSFAEASWVIRTQLRLRNSLGSHSDITKLCQKDSDYDFPTWKKGYCLAEQARQIFNIPENDPIPSLSALCETGGIPLLQAPLSKNIAGATVDVDGHRGIVVNTEGNNANVWIRRSTIAHELGHLLWDPEDRLTEVRVDDYKEVDGDRNYFEIEAKRTAQFDSVEARANAFAIAFLAPPNAVRETFDAYEDESEGLRAVMVKFGISYTSAKHHINNIKNISIADQPRAFDKAPTADWEGSEAYTDVFYVIDDLPALRRGEFSAWVARAEREKIISTDTACTYLNTDMSTYLSKRDTIIGLFPNQ